jgi:hypothetical protein
LAIFLVTFQLKSFYEDEQFDKTVIVSNEYESDDLNDLFELLDDMDEIEKIDDQLVINKKADEDPDEINVEYVLINDSDGNELYRDEDYC